MLRENHIKVTLIFFLMGILFLPRIEADRSVLPGDYTFVVMSPMRRCYAVQSLLDWDVAEIKLEMTSRFQVFDAGSGKLVWQADKEFCTKRMLYLSDDPDFMVVLSRQLWGIGITGLGGKKVTDAPEELQKKILNQVALKFYERGKLLMGYTLADLHIPADSLELSVSHVMFFSGREEYGEQHFDWPDEDYVKHSNPHFTQNTHQFRFVAYDGRNRIFDYKTGKLIKIGKVVETDKFDANDPFSR